MQSLYPPLKSSSSSSPFDALRNRLWNGGVRMHAAEMDEYERDYIDLCTLLKKTNKKEEREMAYNMIAHMRNRYHGRGERDIAYMMVYQWYLHMDADEALSMLTLFTKIGCWKDMKYMCLYIWNRTKNDSHPIIDHCVKITIEQLMQDYLLFLSKSDKSDISISNVSKWIPRENSSFSWVYEKMWKEWMLRNYPYLLAHPKGVNKGRQIYRKWISTLNAHLGTKEIRETRREWEKIAVSKMSYMNLWKTSLTKDYDTDGTDACAKGGNDVVACAKGGNDAYAKGGNDACAKGSNDVVACANTKTTFEKKNVYHTNARFHLLTTCPANNTVSLEEYVKKGCEILDAEECDTLRISLINHLWKNLVETGTQLDAVIPILNVEIDHDEEYTSQMNHALCGAIGVACMIAQKSKIKNRILCVKNNTMTLLNLTGTPKFIDMLREVRTYVQDSEHQIQTDCPLEMCMSRIHDIMLATGTTDISAVIVSNHNKYLKTRIIPGLNVMYWNTSPLRKDESMLAQMGVISGTNTKDFHRLYGKGKE